MEDEAPEGMPGPPPDRKQWPDAEPSAQAPAYTGGLLHLGDDKPSRNLDYLLEDDEPKSHGGRWLVLLVAVALVAGLGWLRWRDELSALLGPQPKSTQSSTNPESGPNTSSPAAPGGEQGKGSSSPASPPPASSGSPAASPANGADTTTGGGTSSSPAPTNSTSPATAAQTTGASPESSATPPNADSAPPAASADSGTPAGAPSPGQGSAPAATAETAASTIAAAPTPTATPEKAKAKKPTPAPKPEDPVTLGEKFLYGRGVSQDCTRGLRYVKPAADRANAKAMITMGALYATGHCLSRDLPTAYRYFALALRQDPENGALKQNVEMVWSKMTKAERDQAIRMTQ